MPDAAATVALFAWPLVAVVLFLRLPVAKAAAATIVFGYLLLPTEPVFNLPLLPAYDHRLAASLPALLLAILMSRTRPGPAASAGGPPTPVLPGWLPRNSILRLCLLVTLVAPAFTVMMNGEALVFPLRVLPGLTPYDIASSVLTAFCMLLPFLVARKFLARPQEQAMLLGLLCVAALFYSLPTLYEVRMSPQLNRMVYGFFPHSWAQHVRDGGFRPLVFLEHGLRLGIFLAMTTIATAGVLRLARGGRRWMAAGAILWLFATLILSKNLGAFLIACTLLPVVLVLGARAQLRVAAILAAMVLFFPVMRAAGLVPTQHIVDAVASFSSQDRVGSIKYRFMNEDILLAKAREKPLFGWGGWGRGRVYDEEGQGTSTTDGVWIIVFGESGWVGYLGKFGLLTVSILLLAFRRKDAAAMPMASSALAVVLAANLVDLIPNSSLTPLTWLMAGSLAGRLEVERAEAPEAEPAAAGPRHLPFRRNLGTATTRSQAPGGQAPATKAAPRTPRRAPGRVRPDPGPAPGPDPARAGRQSRS